jgi:hypothetical protein
MNKIEPQGIWIKANGVRIRSTSISKKGMYVRLFVLIKGEEIDMFPENNDFLLDENGTITMRTTEAFKIKVKAKIE